MSIIFIQRWYVDGSVECFVGEHAPLAISAILVLLFCVLVILLMVAIVMRKIKVCNKLFNLSDNMHLYSNTGYFQCQTF